ALASKEVALPLPVALAAWSLAVERRDARATARRVLPFAAMGVAWGLVLLIFRAGNRARAPLHFEPGHFVAGYVPLIQCLLGIEHPAGFPSDLMVHGPALVPLALL